MSHNKVSVHRILSNRFVKALGILAIVALMLAACTPAEPETIIVTQEVEVPGETVVEMVEVPGDPFPDGTELHMLQWSHFVPQYDVWFDEFAVAWGEANNVEVTVDHLGIADVPPTLAAAIEAGEGPTMVELNIGVASFIEGVHDLTDVNMKAQELFGPQVDTCTANSYLPATDTWYGFCHAWVPDPGDYDSTLWDAVGFPDGPATYDDLLVGGAAIKEQFGVPMGLGLSPEIDSNMAMRAIIWSYGGSVQDADENVVINSPEVIEAAEYVGELYAQTMTDEVFAWGAASNNQGLIAGELSYILNSISAYRSLQKIDPEAADNIGFTQALSGPRGDQHASAHVWNVYVVPDYVDVESDEFRAAEAFMLHLTANYGQAVFNSELYNFPAFKSTAPQLYAEGGWLDIDPFGSRPQDKLTVLLTAEDWVTYLGWPGPANPAVSEVYSTHIIPTMMGKVALGELSAEEAVAEAEAQINEIFEKWREKGFVGGG